MEQRPDGLVSSGLRGPQDEGLVGLWGRSLVNQWASRQQRLDGSVGWRPGRWQRGRDLLFLTVYPGMEKPSMG
jgi:hypothetical protein